MSTRITAVDVHDVRFPTAAAGDGSDALNRGDYSATYVELRSDARDGTVGAGLAFTNGRGNELVCAAVRALEHHVVGQRLEDIFADMVPFWRSLVADVQLRWLGPEKGVIHLATGALVNAVWDLRAKLCRVPLWKLLAGMSAAELVAMIDFRHIDDALDPQEARALLERAAPGAEERERELEATGYPAYTTSVGWLGYPDEKVRALVRAAAAAGWRDVKMKVGGPAGADILGHARIARAVAPVRVATGEVAANRVIFKQLMQAQAIGVCQVDACRSEGSTRCWRSSCSRPGTACRCAPTPAASGCASTCSTWRSSTTCGCRPASRAACDRVRRPPVRALRRPGRGHRRALPRAALARVPAQCRRHTAAALAGGIVHIGVGLSTGRTRRSSPRTRSPRRAGTGASPGWPRARASSWTGSPPRTCCSASPACRPGPPPPGWWAC